MTNSAHIESGAAGLAALSISESLLLALIELKVLTPADVSGVLEDAAALHRGAEDAIANANLHEENVELHREVASVIDRIIAAGKSTFRP